MGELIDRIHSSLADRYDVEREIGRGGMAVVFLAHDLQLGRQVAIKVIRPELAQAVGIERFLREVRIEAALDHPNIAALSDSGEAGGLPYYVMPYVEGDSSHLRSGEIWDERLEQFVQESDIFQLFWSSNAMRSRFVAQEYRYALALPRSRFVRPVYWEIPIPGLGDPPELPPNSARYTSRGYRPSGSQGTNLGLPWLQIVPSALKSPSPQAGVMTATDLRCRRPHQLGATVNSKG